MTRILPGSRAYWSGRHDTAQTLAVVRNVGVRHRVSPALSRSGPFWQQSARSILTLLTRRFHDHSRTRAL